MKFYDVIFHMADGGQQIVARRVTAEQAENIVYNTKRPRGARAVIKPRGV